MHGARATWRRWSPEEHLGSSRAQTRLGPRQQPRACRLSNAPPRTLSRVLRRCTGNGRELLRARKRERRGPRPTRNPLSNPSPQLPSVSTRMQNAQTPGQQQRGTSAPGGGGGGAPAGLGKDSHSNRVDVINTKGGRILCVADVRGESASCVSKGGKVAPVASGVATIGRSGVGLDHWGAFR